MKITDLLNTSIGEIKTNIFRSILSILSIIVGVSSFISIISLNEGMNGKLLETVERLGGYNVFTISPSRKNLIMNGEKISYKYEITLETIKKLKNNFFATFAPEIIGPKIKLPTKQTVTVYGVTPEYFDIFNHDLYKGRLIYPVDLINRNDVILINEEIKDFYCTNGDISGKYVSLSNYKFEIVGCISSRRVYIPATTMATKIINRNPIRKVYVKVRNYKEIQSVKKNIESYLDQISNDTNLFNFDIPSESTERLFELEKSFSRLIIIISIFILLVGGIGIMNIMLASLKERVNEIGIRKAIGAKNDHIFFQFLIESLSIFFIGSTIGIIIGIAGVNIISENLLQNYISGKTEAIISLKVIFIPLMVSLVIGLIFGLYPALKAARITPINALRYE